MVLFQRGYGIRSRTRPSTGVGGDTPDLTRYATKVYVNAAILVAESDTDAIKQEIDNIENTTNVIKQDVINIGNATTSIITQVNDITSKAVISDGNGRVDGKNGSSVIDLIVSKRGIRTLRANDSFNPSARIATRNITLPTSEPEFLEGVVEAYGMGAPEDGYVFYRYDDSNVIDGLNSRVEIEMPRGQGVYIRSRSYEWDG